MSEPTLPQALPRSAARSRETAAAPRKRAAPRGTKGQPKLKIQIDFPGGARLGPGKVALLEAIDREGSLSRAAENLGISYRRAWLFMQQINQAFDEVAVATPEHGHGGGPARITPFGRELIRHYRTMEQEAVRVGEQIMLWLDRHRTDRGPSDKA
ncbi:MAG: winged helix-turn-helix domain-containing protein [Hyphomicrobium sp.]